VGTGLAERPAGKCFQTEVDVIAADEKKNQEAPGADDAEKDASSESTEESKPAKKLSAVTIIIAAVVSFVIFLGAFSYFMGVFDPAPPPEVADTAAAENGATDDQMPGNYVSPYGQAAAAVEEAQRTNAVDTLAELSLLDARRKELDAEERKITKERKELEDLRAQIETLMNKKEAVAEEKLVYIAKLIDGMKPDEMSGLISNLDNPTIMSVLPRMKPQTASRVLATLPPERAAKITMELIKSDKELATP
jgi:flagellar motility protein MotE (MotC chaperone)